MKIIISNALKEPIYEQISRQIKELIFKGELKEGDMLPSIRGLAREIQISVITTKRAYEELEREGFIVTVRGKGSYVAAQNTDLLREQKLKLIEDKLSQVVEESRVLNLGFDDIKNILKVLFEE